MTWGAAAAIALGGTGLATPASLTPLRPSLERLAELGGRVFTLGEVDDILYVRYCPDSTCIEIQEPRTGSLDVFEDFTVAYLYYASQSTALREFVSSDARQDARAIVGRFADRCGSSVELERASCALSALSSTGHLRAVAIRSEAGTEVRSPVDLTKELSVDRLNEVQRWRAREWRPE